MTDENTLEQTEIFPDKPLLEEAENSVLKSIGSLVLFIAAFYLFFNKDVFFIVILVTVLFIHESGHFLAMKYFNYKDVKVFFIPLLGALATGTKKDISQKERTVILMAGPVPGIIIGIVLFLIPKNDQSENILMIANIFLFLNIFNLLPLTPLDGGQLIETLFFTSKDTLRTIFNILSAAALVIIGFYTSSYVLLIIPFFLLMQLMNRSQLNKVKLALDEKGIDYNKPFDELSNNEYWLIRAEIIINMAAFRNVEPYEYLVSNKEKLISNTIKSLYVRSPIADLSWKSRLLFALLWALFFCGPCLYYFHYK